MRKRSNRPADRDFQKLAERVNNTLKQNKGLIGDQSEQVKLVFDLERKFQHYIQRYHKTGEIYEKFINKFVSEGGNILNARPYFRERSPAFSSGITKAIKEKNVKDLMKYHINFQLINFIVKNWNGDLPERPRKYYEDFIEARRILIENNIPLAINRAKIFYRKVPRSHMTLLDFINICTCGLISGIDKYVGDYTKGWRGVAIGRMVGYMIEDYSKPFLRMYPTDKKILYRANALKYRLKIEDTIELTKAVNESFENDKKEGKKIPKLPITEVHIRTLLNGSHYISADNKTGDDEEEEKMGVYDYTPDSQPDPEERMVKSDLMIKILKASKELSMVERKIIRLKGVEL